MHTFALGGQDSCSFIGPSRSFSDPRSCCCDPLGHSFFPLLQIKPNFCILFHMTPLFDIQSCHARPFAGHLSSKWPFLWRSAQKKCAVEGQRCSLSATGCIVIMRSGGATLLIISNARVHPHGFLRSAVCCP